MQEGKKSEKVAAYLVTRVARARPEQTAGEVRSSILEAPLDSTEAVYIVDARGRLVGLLSVPDLLQMPEQRPVGLDMQPDPPAVLRTDDQERAASLAVDRGLAAVPVTDEGGMFLGVVPARALIRILRQEHIEDLARFTGMMNETATALYALEANPLRRAMHRLPWLLIGLLGSFFATFVMAWFEPALQRQIAIAFFVPGIIYLADAIGTQTEAIAVRGLSFSVNSFGKLLAGEMLTGFLLGGIIGLLAFPVVVAAYGDMRLAGAISLSLVAAGSSATSVGILFPWFIGRLGYDPAFGSGPLATIFQDIFSLVVYFAVVTLLML